MKLNKITAGLAAICCAALASAQTVTLRGNLDYSANGVRQSFWDSETLDDSDHSDPAANVLSTAETVVDLTVTAANFEFNLGVKLNAGAGDEGDGVYVDCTDSYDGTPFYQGNMKIGFFDDQIKVYTGKFEDFDADYIPKGYVFDDSVARYFASGTMGQHYTALEVTPYAVSGLRFLVGLPILPGHGNGVNTDIVGNQWKVLYKKVNIAAAFKLADSDITLSAGWRPGTYYTGVKAYDGAGSATYDTDWGASFTKSAFGEAFVGADLRGLAEGVDLNAVADFRYRDAEYKRLDGGTEEPFSFMVSAMVGAGLSLIEALPLQAELRFWYAHDDYLADSEKLLAFQLGVAGQHRFSGTAWSAGFSLSGRYGVDARGTAFQGAGYGLSGAYLDDEQDMGDMGYLAAPETNAGLGANYLNVLANPYIQYNLQNGYVRLGLKVEYALTSNEDDTNWGLEYRVPLGIVFNF